MSWKQSLTHFARGVSAIRYPEIRRQKLFYLSDGTLKSSISEETDEMDRLINYVGMGLARKVQHRANPG
ncbi:MAG: hypothetical protein GXY06_08885 [Clostridiaceae bacterium]|nr:hypothetical protein [Clostridiaceae bacterium]